MTSLYSGQAIRAGLKDFVLARLLSAVLSLGTNILLVRWMDEAGYAGYVTLTSLQLSSLLLFSFGIERVLARFSGQALLAWPRAAFKLLVAGSLALRVVSLMLLGGAVHLIGEQLVSELKIADWHEVEWAFWCYAITFGVYEALQACSQSLMQQKAIRDALTFQWLARFVVIAACFLVTGEVSVERVLWTFGVTALLSSLHLLRAIYQQAAVTSPTAVAEAADFRALVALGWHNHVEKLVSLPFSTQFVRLVSANALNLYAVALLGFYQTLVMTFHRHMPSALAMGMLESAIAGRMLRPDGRAESAQVLSTVFKVNLAYVLSLAAWLCVSGQAVLTLITGGKYAEQSAALVLLVLGLVPGGLWQLFIIYCNATNEAGVLPKATFVSLLLLLPVLASMYLFSDMGVWIVSGGLLLVGIGQCMVAHLMLAARTGAPAIDFAGAAKFAVCVLVPSVLLRQIVPNSGLAYPLAMALAGLLVTALLMLGLLRLGVLFSDRDIGVLDKLSPPGVRLLRKFHLIR